MEGKKKTRKDYIKKGEVFNSFTKPLKELILDNSNDLIGTPMLNLFKVYTMLEIENNRILYNYANFSIKIKEKYKTFEIKDVYRINIVNAVLNYEELSKQQKDILYNRIKINLFKGGDIFKNKDYFKYLCRFINQSKITFDIDEFTEFDDIYECFKEYCKDFDYRIYSPISLKIFMYKHLGLPMYIKGGKFYFGLT